MAARLSGPDFPWRLRVEHEGLLSLRLDRRGRCVRVDPKSPPAADDIVILTGSWPEQLDATRAAVRAGTCPTVVAQQAVLDWLREEGAIHGHILTAHLDGMSIELRPFVPIPYATPIEALYKVQSAVVRPDRAVRRLVKRRSYPRCGPVAFRIQFADGASFFYAGLALHSGTPPEWISNVREDWGTPEWLVAGVDHGHGPDVVRHVTNFGARHIVFVDLLSELRSRLGLPTELLTPVRDAAVAQGLPADVFAAGAGLRYE